jgi:hypothetical protein
MASKRKPMSVAAVVETILAPSPHEQSFVTLFDEIDPSQELTFPALFVRCGELLDRAAAELRLRGESAAARGREQDALHLRAIADWILGIDDRATRHRVQDLPEAGFARLVELMAVLVPRAKSADSIMKALDGIKAGVLAAVDKLAPAEEGDDDDR